MSARDTARLLLAGVPTAREVDYHEWTASKPECRGELRAAGEVLWFTYAEDDAPPVRDLPTEPGAVVLVTELRGETFDPPIPALRDTDRDDRAPWCSGGHVGGDRFHDSRDITGWIPARVVRDDEQGPVEALRRIMDAVQEKDGLGCIKTLQAVEFAAREALKALDGEGS
jgi:hypothetical protein